MPELPAMHVAADGWVDGMRRHPSPNVDARPEGMPIDLIVLHNISLPPAQSGTDFGTDDVLDFFSNSLDCDAHPYFDQLRGVRVSAHFFIRRSGECVQFAPCEARAWHAGASDFFGRTRCNDFSIGHRARAQDRSRAVLRLGAPAWARRLGGGAISLSTGRCSGLVRNQRAPVYRKRVTPIDLA
jgi:AmpD protein